MKTRFHQGRPEILGYRHGGRNEVKLQYKLCISAPTTWERLSYRMRPDKSHYPHDLLLHAILTFVIAGNLC